MNRRSFLRKAATGVAAGATVTLAACTQAPATTNNAPAQGEELPTLNWRMTTSWPTSLDTIYGGAVTTAERVAAMTNGKFNIRPFAAGEIVPATQVLDAVQAGTVEMGHTASYYYVGKSPVFAFGTALPFGLNAQQQNAWLFEGGGLEQLQTFYREKGYNTILFPAGNTGVQMGGWFKREVNTVADLNGLKMRIPGLGGQVMTKLGVTVQVLGAGEIFQALDTGAVDAAEFVGPYDDEKLGFQNAAEYYYAPGWWEPGPSLEVQVNLEKWNSLPKEYQEIVKTAAHEANTVMLARYDARNGEALARLLQGGVQLRSYSEEIMAAAEAAALELYNEFSAADADFKAIYESWKPFRSSVQEWNKINEFSIANHFYNNSNF